jgi:predicted NBD/HSP70 family sugar kinase
VTHEETARPSLGLLRSLTDEHVLRALMRNRRLTRAELAAETGISKPSVGESVRRLTETGLLADTGERTPGGRGRGRVGSYYALAEDIGGALAISIAPEGVTAELVDAHGDTVSRAEAEIGRPARPEPVTAALRSAAADVTRGARPGPQAAVVSAAGPVDRASGRLVRLPDEPFILGDLDAAAALRPLVRGPVVVDNDVNWAARAERDNAETAPGGDFAYLFLGEGLGAAIVSNGEVVRGHAGLAGEIAHVITPGPGGRPAPFIDVFGALGLRQAGSTAIDVRRLLARVAGDEPAAAATRDVLADATSGVLAALIALADPQLVVIGGSWGSQPAVLASISAAAAALPRRVLLRPAAIAREPSLAGARAEALRLLRIAIIDAARDQAGPPRRAGSS